MGRRATSKRVPTGHDSPWTAGEALSSEIVRLKDVDHHRGSKPHWQSVLAIPVFAERDGTPPFATAVLTFGLARSVSSVRERQPEGRQTIEDLSAIWGARISEVAFAHERG